MRNLDVIVPVYDEAKNIPELVRRIDQSLRAVKINYKIIFVDDNSTDGTCVEIKKLIKKYPITLHLKKGQKGKAYSIIEGARLAKSEFVAMIDGDLQYPPEELPKMYELAQENGVVVANRTSYDAGLIRKFGSKINAFLFGKLLLGLNCDAQSGLKVFRKEIISHLTEKDVSPWTLDMPLLHTAVELGYSIGCTEIEFNERLRGESKVNFIKTSVEIARRAIGLKVRSRKVYKIEPQNGLPLGAGYIHKKKRFVTHTHLPHEQSALKTFAVWQKSLLILLFLLFILGLIINAKSTAILLIAILTAIYFVDAVFSAFVLIKSLHFPPELRSTDEELEQLDNKKLPVYTILCPLYKEGKVLPDFLENIKGIDWPKKKLDVLLLLEEDDKETQEVAKNLNLPNYVKVLIVPDSQPKTKPKACNYGLIHAKGDYVVIYDAEDRPDPLQLKKAYLGFQKVDPKTICLQSKLNYYNPNHNLLTRLFTAEYSLWFDVILPGLQSIDTHIPLGGTSNHFRSKDLVGIHAWDPFNVTEDCDLGVRIFKNGYKTAIIDSVTLEEANSNVKNWLRQRSRWIKGYLQTYLVHMKHPIQFVKQNGIHALLFQLVIGMRMTFMIINPILWITTIVYFAARAYVGPTIEALYPTPVFYAAVFSLIFGNFMYLYNYMIGAAKREHFGVIKYVFFIPFYWVLTSVSACIAFYQLIVKPHYWEKTHHGLHLPETDIKKNYYLNLNWDFYQPVFKSIARLRNIPVPEFSSALTLVFAAMAGNVLNFITSIYLGRSLTSEEFGLVSLMTSFLFMVQLFSSGIGQTISHQSALLYGKYGKPIGEILNRDSKHLFKISLILSFIWCIAIPFQHSFFNSHTIVPFLVFAPMWIILMVGAVNSGFLNGNLKFHLIAVLIITEALLKLLFSVLFVELGFGDWVYSALPLSLFVGLIMSAFFASKVAKKFSLGSVKHDFGKELSFPKKFFINSFLVNITSISFLSLDLVFVKHFLSATEAGEYALLVLAGRIVIMVGSVFSQFILPFVSKEVGVGKDSNKVFLGILSAVSLSSFLAFAFVGVGGFKTMPILFGEKANIIVPYLVPYAFSMTVFTIANSLVVFHQAKKQYAFTIPGVLTVIFQGVGLYVFHEDVWQVVNVMIASGLFLFFSSVLFHIFINQINVFLSNFNDFIGLFFWKINGKKPLEGSNLRILIYNWRDTKHMWAGGAEVYVHELAKRWVKEGHKVTVFCGNDGRSKRNEKIDGVQIVRRGGFYTVYLWAFLYYLIHFRRRYDVIVESENGVPFFTPLYSTKPKVLIVHHVHQEVFRNHLKFPFSVIAGFVESRLTPLVYVKQKIVAVSNSTKNDLAVAMSLDVKNIEVVNPGVCTEAFTKSSKTPYPSFVYLGRHKAYKNIDIAIIAFSRVLKVLPTAKLTIAGDGETTDALRELTRNLNIEKSVRFLGRVSESQKNKVLGESWVAIQPSSFEGWGITVLETNACGTPVIASKVKGLCDSVVDGKTGILVPHRNTQLFAKAMVGLAVDDLFRKRLSDSAYDWSWQFNWDRKAEEFIEIIKTVTGVKEHVYSDPNLAYMKEEEQ